MNPISQNQSFVASAKCVLSFDAFNEVAKEADERTKEIELMKAKLEFLEKEKKKPVISQSKKWKGRWQQLWRI
jgi:hypothetical protein